MVALLAVTIICYLFPCDFQDENIGCRSSNIRSSLFDASLFEPRRRVFVALEESGCKTFLICFA